MKFAIKISVITAIVCLTSLTVAKKEVAHYFFKNKYDRSSVVLYDNGTFAQSKHGCTYSFNCKGHWIQSGDTIKLHQEKFKKSWGGYDTKRASQLILFGDGTANYLWNIQNGFGDSFIMHLAIE